MSGVGTPRTQESLCNQKPGMVYRGDKRDGNFQKALYIYIFLIGFDPRLWVFLSTWSLEWSLCTVFNVRYL